MVRSPLEHFRKAALEIKTELFGKTSEEGLCDRVVQIILEKSRSNIVFILRPDASGRALFVQSIACIDPALRDAFLHFPFSLDPSSLDPLPPVAAFREGRVIGPERGSIPLGPDIREAGGGGALVRSLVGVPLLRFSSMGKTESRETLPYGVLAFDLPDHEQYPDDLRESVDLVVRELGEALARLEIRARLSRILAEGQESALAEEISTYLTRLLLEMGQFLRDSGEGDPSEVMAVLVDTLAFFLGYPVLWIGKIPPGESELQMLALGGEARGTFSGIRVSIDQTIPEGRGLVGECATLGGPREGDLLSSDPRFFPWRDRFRMAGVESALVDQAITSRGDKVYIALYRRISGPFWGGVVELASSLVRDLASSLDRFRLKKEREKLESSRKAIRLLQKELWGVENSRKMFDGVVRIVSENCALQGVLVLEPDGRGILEPVSLFCAPSLLEATARSGFGFLDEKESQRQESLASRAFLSGVPAMSQSSTGLPEKSDEERSPDGFLAIRSAFACPLGRPGKPPLAVLLLWSADPEYFSPEITVSFEEIAETLSMGLERLSREEEVRRLSLVARRTNDGILLLDREGRILWANPSFQEKFGYSQESLSGRNPSDFIFEESGGMEKGEIWNSLLGGNSSDHVFRCRSEGGRLFWVRVSVSSLNDEKGEGAGDGLVCIATDITTLKESESRARVASVFYRALSETTQGLGDLSEAALPVLASLSDTLRDVLGATAVYIGRLPFGETVVERMAFSGPDDWYEPLGKVQGPDGPLYARALEESLRTGRPQIYLSAEKDEGLPPGERTVRNRVVGGLTATAVRSGGEKVVLEVLFPEDELIRDEAAIVFQKIINEVATYLDRREWHDSQVRVESYRAALQVFSRQLLSASTEEEAFRLLVRIFSERTDTLAVDCLVPEGEFLVRKFLGGDLASVIGSLPGKVPAVMPATGPLPTPTRAFLLRESVFVRNPASDPRMLDLYRTPPFESISLVVSLPVPGPRPEDPPLAIVVLFFSDPKSLDDLILMELVGNILDHASRTIERLRLLRRMESLSVEDPLTGLLNRRGLGLFLPPLLATLRRRHGRALLGILDLDDFKWVNDSYGHAAGDALLSAVGRRLQEGIRREDIVARLGGDEFVVVIQLPSSADEEGAEDPVQGAMERIGHLLLEPYFLEEPPQKGLTVAFSMGITLLPEDDAEPDVLLRRADEALYVSKRQKGIRSRWWSIWKEGVAPHPRPDLAAPLRTRLFFDAYGERARNLLSQISERIAVGISEFSGYFYDNLSADPRSREILGRLSPKEFAVLRERQERHLREILSPDLSLEEHRRIARRIGRVHAMVGVSPAEMGEAMRVYMASLLEIVEKLPISPGDRNSLWTIVAHRSGVELAEELEGIAESEGERRDAMLAASALLLESRDYPDRIRALAGTIVRMEGIETALVLAPENAAGFPVEWAGGLTDPFLGDGSLPDFLKAPLRKAWRSDEILSFPVVRPGPDLSEEGAVMLRSHGIRSLVLVPVRWSGDAPGAILLMASSFPGYFDTPAGTLFVGEVRSILRQAGLVKRKDR